MGQHRVHLPPLWEFWKQYFLKAYHVPKKMWVVCISFVGAFTSYALLVALLDDSTKDNFLCSSKSKRPSAW